MPKKHSVAQRLAERAAEITLNDPSQDDIAFVHAVNSQVYYPRSRTDEDLYVRKLGQAKLSIQSGYVSDPMTGEDCKSFIPYGTKPRLLKAYIDTFAVMNRTRDIDVGRSLTNLIQTVDGHVTGGKTGNLGRWKSQLTAISVSNTKIQWGHMVTRMDMAQEIQLFSDNSEPGQPRLWPEYIRLSSEYYEHLLQHALPLDSRALRALSHSALAYDVYSWLSPRLRKVKSFKGDMITWSQLHQQFGPEYRRLSEFKRKFKPAFDQATSLYLGSREATNLGSQGLLVKYARPPIPEKSQIIQV